MIVAFPIGWAVSHIMLAALFYGLFTPVALVFRTIGRTHCACDATVPPRHAGERKRSAATSATICDSSDSSRTTMSEFERAASDRRQSSLPAEFWHF